MTGHDEKYYSLLHFAPFAFFHGDPQGNFLIVNEKAEALTGYSSEELLSMNMSDLFSPDELAAKPLRYDLLKQNHTIKTEREIIRKDGEKIYVEMNSLALPDGTYQSYVINITEQNLVVQSLQKSEERYRKLVELSPIGIAIHQDGIFVYGNPEGLKIMGCQNLQELIGKPVLSIVHPDSLNTVIERMTKVAKGALLPPVEEKLIRQDGTIFYAEVTALSTTFNERPAGQVIVRDITAQKMARLDLQESEEKFKQLFENAADAIFIAEIETGLLIDANKAACRMIMLPREKIIGMHQTMLHPPSEMAYSKESYRRHIEGADLSLQLHPVENKILCADGSEVPVEVLASKILIKGKTYLMGTFRDISIRKQSEEKLLQINKKLQELNSTRDKLFSIIAHDLRGPFNSILGLSELLLDNINVYDVSKAHKFVSHINDSAKNTLTLLDNLLNWAKTQTGQIEFKPEKLELKPIVQGITDAFSSLSAIKNIVINIDHSCDIKMYADKNMLETILRNLISNAVKFTSSGGFINIAALEQSSEVEIIVSDNGIGMNDETLKRIFKVDGNYTSVGTANEQGSGLGLILCNEFVTAHNGKLRVESEAGKGSSFYVLLPCGK